MYTYGDYINYTECPQENKYRLNTDKTKTMIISANENKHKIELDDKIWEQVNSFIYLGTIKLN